MTSTVTLTLNLTAKTGRVTDTTDYAALNIDVAATSALALASIKFQGDLIVQKNTVGDPLIDLGAGDTYFDFPLELDANGDVAYGVYEITGYQVVITETVNNISFDEGVYFSGADDIADSITAGDTIVIPSGTNAGTYTILTALYLSGLLGLQVEQDTVTELNVSIPSLIYLNPVVGNQTYSYQGCTQLTPSATFSYDCSYGANGTWSVTNATPITTQTLVSLSGNIYWPSLTDLAPIAITSLPYSNNTLATGVYAINFTQVISQVESDGLILQYSINFAQEFDPVICTSNLCGLMVCFSNLLAAHLAALESSKVSQYQASYDAAVGYIEEYRTYMSCAENAKALEALAKLKLVLDSSGCDCGCCDDEQGSIWVNNYSVTSLVEWGLFDGEPSVNQDTNHGYQLGSKLCDINTGITYTCDNPANGAAEWSVYYDPSLVAVPTLQEVVDEGNVVAVGNNETAILIENDSSVDLIVLKNVSNKGTVSLSSNVANEKVEYDSIGIGITKPTSSHNLKYSPIALDGMVGENFNMVSQAPSATDDASKGYVINHIVNYNGVLYICTDNTDNAAVWDVYYNPVLSVYDDLVAEGTDENTTAVLQYGVNVFRTVTPTDYCAKLPQPTTGRVTTVVNMTNAVLVLYPSNVGGQINNLPINTPAIIPPNGVAYDFTCIENPLPGAWSWTPPATSQYDSGDITSDTSGGFNMIMAANNNYQVERASVYAGTQYAYNGLLTPNIMIDPAPTSPPGFQAVMFKEAAPWLGITKIKWYTNLSGNGFTGGLLTSMAVARNLYDPITGDFIDDNGMYAGTLSATGGSTYTVAGATLAVGELTANVGDAGTVFGEVYFNSAQINGISVIGNVYQGQITNPSNPSQTVDQWISGALGVFFRNNQVLTGFKWRFFVEHY